LKLCCIQIGIPDLKRQWHPVYFWEWVKCSALAASVKKFQQSQGWTGRLQWLFAHQLYLIGPEAGLLKHSGRFVLVNR